MTIEKYIETASVIGASDVHLVYGLPPKCRKDGKLVNLAEEPLTAADCESMAEELAGPLYRQIETTGSCPQHAGRHPLPRQSVPPAGPGFGSPAYPGKQDSEAGRTGTAAGGK